MTQILIGADPEIFVTRGGVNVSAHDLIPGTKKNPFKVKNGAVQIDGTALEFNIEPAATADQFVLHIQTVMQQLSEMVKDKDASVDFAISPSVVYSKDIFSKIPESALELGCEPDYNAYTGLENERPSSERLKGFETMRTGSGHVHIGWTKNADPFDPAHFADCRILTKVLDAVLGSAALNWDTDRQRVKLYGAPGSFRPKPYGMEYRVLSNAWLKDPALVRFVYSVTRQVTEILSIYGKTPWDKLFGGNWSAAAYPQYTHASYYAYYYRRFFGPMPNKMGQTRYDATDFRKLLPDGGVKWDAHLAGASMTHVEPAGRRPKKA